MVDLTGLPIIDIHAHPFLNHGEMSADEFTNSVTFGGGTDDYMHEWEIELTPAVKSELLGVKHGTLYFKRMMLDLAGYFGIEPDIEAVIAARNQAIAAGYTNYVRDLYADAGVTGVVFDFGIPLPMLDIDAVKRELPIGVYPIFRIEPLIADLLTQQLTWNEFRQTYDDTLNAALTTGGYLGLKSIIAYRTGLDVSPLSRTADQGYQALDAIKRGLGGGSMKKLRDHLLCRALEISIDHQKPMQIHTGMGDFEVNLILCRPSYLMDLLRFPAYRDCHVILVHSGYPYHREAAYMANVLPRVHLDVSEGIPFASNAAWDIFEGVLAMAPVNKICYGSDGYKVPEIIYTSAKLGRQALQDVLNMLVTRRMMTESDAQIAGGMILAENTRNLYGLR